MITIQNQNFGVEIELTGISREVGAQVIADYFSTSNIRHVGSAYGAVHALDRKGRTWKCMRDSSIRPQVKCHGRIENTNNDLRCEVVTPILQYEDLEDLQQIVRNLREKGAFANSSCGIHVHVDGINHTPESLTRLINFAVGRQDLFYEALEIGDREDRWCKKINSDLLTAMKHDTVKTKESVERIWYSGANDGYGSGISHEHYNPTRYHGINLHAFFTKGTVEFRLFNGTTHAGKIKAYIQFCLAMSAWAINANGNIHFMKSTHYADKVQRGKLMLGVLKNRLGMRGKEFKTARYHLTAAFTEQPAA
ncbi:MAG: amidoligase family protein [Aristaeellaceae bacterium]